MNPVNQMIHKICVPAIVWSLLGCLRILPFPFADSMWLNWSTLFVVLCLVFYLSLDMVSSIGIVLFTLPLIYMNEKFLATGKLHYISIFTFVIAWIFQFIGHKLEGKKPSFFKDIQFLLIGPLWVINKLFENMGIRKFPDLR